MDLTDFLIKCMNFKLLLFHPKKFNFRWANSTRDHLAFVGQFAKDQFYKVYGRITSRYNYHAQQMRENAIRRFDVTDTLMDYMKQGGNAAFYKAVCGVADLNERQNWEVDLTRICDLSTMQKAGDYVYQQVYQRRLQSNDNRRRTDARESAEVARTNYMRGFSRLVKASDYDDWEKLRNELRRKEHKVESLDDHPEHLVTLIALSYKGKDINVTRRMKLLKEDGSPDFSSGVMNQETIEMTSDFMDDFRWSQLIRSCVEIAEQKKTQYVRVWIDRLIMMGYESEETARRYDLVDWEEFGLLAYAVCPVVRLYDDQEKYAGSDFWRKLEAVLGVAGCGIVVDDYMLRKYDETIFYGPKMYTRLNHGLSRIGGYGTYVKGTTLALATAILTDGVSTNAKNEDTRTKRAVGTWKAWALRTIAEGAYSKEHFSMLAQEEEFRLGFEQFRVIALWESFASRSKDLTGKSYLDMSYQRSRTWTKSARWNGILEWIGRIDSSCHIDEQDKIMAFLTNHVKMKLLASTTGHVACWITLRENDRREGRIEHERSLVVNLTRFSTGQQGHVTGIAEATGLWDESILPWYLFHWRNPDYDQNAKIVNLRCKEYGAVWYEYKRMTVMYIWAPVVLALLALLGLAVVVAVLVVLGKFVSGFLAWALGVILALIGLYFLLTRNWPWVDYTDVGEALFDNLILHSLYGSGIKKQYRKLTIPRYDEVSRHWD